MLSVSYFRILHKILYCCLAQKDVLSLPLVSVKVWLKAAHLQQGSLLHRLLPNTTPAQRRGLGAGFPHLFAYLRLDIHGFCLLACIRRSTCLLYSPKSKDLPTYFLIFLSQESAPAFSSSWVLKK